MAKMRVHELAKELNIKSQEVIDTLNGTQFAVKNVQSGLEDEAQQIVRKKYAKTEVKKDAPKKEEPKKEEPKKDEAKAADRPKKKASIRVIVTQDVLVRKIVLNRTKLTVCESAAEIMEITVRSAEMAMADAIISHHVLSSTALLSQDLSERELCAL